MSGGTLLTRDATASPKIDLGRPQQTWVVAEEADRHVALAAQQPTDRTGPVVMIYMELVSKLTFADRAHAKLRPDQLIEVGKAESVLSAQVTVSLLPLIRVSSLEAAPPL